MESPKDPDSDNVFALYSLLATPDEESGMRNKYTAGNYGYGHAKQELFELIVKKFAKEREAYRHYVGHPDELEKRLEEGEAKARVIARKTLDRVRERAGFSRS
jgi:tryptophanyl-tRNA synthetase